MKEFKTYEDQIQLLMSRGIIISDESFALTKLKEENYYNIINGYKDCFLDKTKPVETYIDGVKFEEIYYLYDFDRILRNILFKPILKIENMLRSLISYTFSEKYSCDNYLKFSNFETLCGSYGVSVKTIEKRAFAIHNLIANLQSDIARNIDKKDYIHHYVMKYGFVPLWVLVNAITLGRLSNFYSVMKQDERIKISMHWNIEEKDLGTYIGILAHYRNLCAHDERIFSSKTGALNMPDTSYHLMLCIQTFGDRYTNGKNDLFSLIIILKIMLSDEDFRAVCNKIEGRMISLGKKLQSININTIYQKMGFPNDWTKIKKL